MEPFEDDAYLSVTMDFRCDLRCTHCMIDLTKRELEPQSEQNLDRILERHRKKPKHRGIIFTGAEVTLSRDLPRWVEKARAAGFARVRVQTHGMGLADPTRLQTYLDAGVNEFFISVIAAQPQTHDRVAKRAGAFANTLRGLDNLEQRDEVLVITNTVITSESYRELPEVAALLAPRRRIHRLEFWNYWPMAQTDEHGLMVSVAEIQPYLKRAIAVCQEAGTEVRVKNYPACLLGDAAWAVRNDQPALVIDRLFYDTYRQNGFGHCPHRDTCSHGSCNGLTEAHVRKFGPMEGELAPIQIRRYADATDPR